MVDSRRNEPAAADTRSVPSCLGHLEAVTRALAACLALIKFRYHVTFINAAFGALIFADRLDRDLAWRLLALYVSFNVLLYSGLYTINDLADRESDARHPLKRRRPIPSGRVSVRTAEWWASVCLASGMASAAFVFGTPIVWCYFGGRGHKPEPTPWADATSSISTCC